MTHTTKCQKCGRMHDPSWVQAIGTYPTLYKANFPFSLWRETREEAEKDMCRLVVLRGERHE